MPEFYDDLSDFEETTQTKKWKRKRDKLLRKRKITKTSKSKVKKSKRSKSKWCVLKDSKVTRDERFKERPTGLGVFATRKIKKKIYFYGEWVCKTKVSRTSQRYYYGVTSDFNNYMITPTEEQIESGNLKYYWRINHSTHLPTHRLEYDCTSGHGYLYGRPVLIPLRTVKAGEEITFDYNNKLN